MAGYILCCTPKSEFSLIFPRPCHAPAMKSTAFIPGTAFSLKPSRPSAVRQIARFRNVQIPTAPATMLPVHRKISMCAPSQNPRSEVLEGPFEGKFGTWYLTRGAANEVLVYRLCMLISSLSTAGMTFLALSGGRTVPSQVYDIGALVFAAAFGGALQTIHIYAKPLHKLLKILWAIGAGSGLVLALSPLVEHGVIETVFDKPALLLTVGWSLVSLTGLFIKEAMCFGRLEALLLIALVPVLSGGHFLGALPPSVEKSGAALFATLFVFFALRKFSQRATDDIGDMSVFEHLAKGGQL